jgi:DNA-binding NarL/FixJ family response regulator
MTIRVVIAEDHPLSREGLRQYLSMPEDIKVVGEASNGLELLELLQSMAEAPDVAVVDARMPALDGIAAARAMSERFPEVAVVILSAFDDPELVEAALQAGVRGYVLKDRDAQDLIRAVRRVFIGERFIDTQRQSTTAK